MEFAGSTERSMPAPNAARTQGVTAMPFERDMFRERERGLENEFFYRVDQELLKKLREQIQARERKQRLAEVTGIKDDAVLEELANLGITEESLLAFQLVPLLKIAWADRVMDMREREALLQAVEAEGIRPGTPAYELITQWLQRPPGEQLWSAWKKYAEALRDALPQEQLKWLRDDLVSRMQSIAEAAGGFLGLNAVSMAEQAVIDEVTQVLTTQSG
ncbi:MAG: hypothetical protein D6725_12230 [Planctomycetota bacterium]|nr:MAG: hypothetical protein D6725_12230 [Planctomycetota bacterium]